MKSTAAAGGSVLWGDSHMGLKADLGEKKKIQEGARLAGLKAS